MEYCVQRVVSTNLSTGRKKSTVTIYDAAKDKDGQGPSVASHAVREIVLTETIKRTPLRRLRDEKFDQDGDWMLIGTVKN